MRRHKMKQKLIHHKPQRTSVIMWRGEIFKFIEPIQEDDLLQFFATVKHRQGQLPRCDIGKVDTFFHGAGDCPINNAVRMCEESKTNNKIYYFPNNEMGKPHGWYDAMVSKIVPYPSKDDAKYNGCNAGRTLYILCKHAHEIQNCDKIVPSFKGVSAGINTMWHGINGFLDKIQNDITLLTKTFITRRKIYMSQIPIAGYKGATPEDTAKLICDAEGKISRIQTEAGYRHANKDKYNLEIYDDYKFKVARLHHIENTQKCLEYFNDHNRSIPLCISRHINSPHESAEKSLFDEIGRNKYRCLKGSTLYVMNEYNNVVEKIHVSPQRDAILNRHNDKSSDISRDLSQSSRDWFCCLNNYTKLANMNNNNNNVSFDLKNAYTQQTQKEQEKC